MRELLLFLLLAGCGGEVEPSEGCDPSLPATDDDGSAWPSYDAARASWTDCARFAPPSRSRGTCSDGKQFIDYNGGFTGETLYFRDGVLTGVNRWTDIITGGDCRGGLGDTSCEPRAIEEELHCP